MKKTNILFIAGVILTLTACGQINFNSTYNSSNSDSNSDVIDGVEIANRLAYQTTTSLASMVDISINNSITSKVMKLRHGNDFEDEHEDRHYLLEENKEKIESILPTLNLLLENDNNFENVVYESDREGFDYKQVVSLNDLFGEKISYTLYYNLAQDDADSDVEDLPENPGDIVVPPSSEEESNSSNDSENVSENVSENISENNTEIMQKHHDGKDDHDFFNKDHDKHGDCFHRDDKDRDEKVTIFGGVAVVDDLEYPFMAKSSEEIDDEEIEKKFAMKIFTSDHRGSITVVHEVEEDDEEIEESYQYIIKEGRHIKNSFKFENSNSIEETEEYKIKLSLDNERYSFKVYEIDGVTYIRVKFDKRHEDHGKLVYKKVVTQNEDGTVTVSFEEVI